LDIIIVIDAHIEGKVMQGNVSCRFDGFCFCPHIYCWLMFEVEMRLMVLSLDVKYTDSCDAVSVVTVCWCCPA